MKKNRLFAILIAFFTFSCFAQNWKADHVFLIGLDGWGAYSVEKAEMPNVKTLMDAGCYCNLQIFLCLFLEKLNMPQNTPVTKVS